MSDSPFIQLASNEALFSEVEAREKRAPMPEDLRSRWAAMFRSSIEGTLSGVSENGDQARIIESYQGVRKLTDFGQKLLFMTLQSEFERHPERHKVVEWDKVKKTHGANPKAFKSILEKAMVVDWEKVKKALEANSRALWSIQKMEESGGRPDIFRIDKEGFEIGDCTPESPSVRRYIAYDNAAFLAEQWGVELMSEEQYRHLQIVGRFDKASECWLGTPSDMRGGGRANCGLIHPTAGVCVVPGNALDTLERRGFRCALRVEWVKEKERISFWKKLIK